MKDSPRIEAYGEVDELNSLIGLIISQDEIKQEAFSKLATELTEIQHLLFDVGTDLANIDGELPCASQKSQQNGWSCKLIGTLIRLQQSKNLFCWWKRLGFMVALCSRGLS